MNEHCVDEYIQYVKEIYNRDVEFVSPEDIVKRKELPNNVAYLLYEEDVAKLNSLLSHNLPYSGGTHWSHERNFPIMMHSEAYQSGDGVFTGWMNFSPTDEYREGETDIGKKSIQWYYDNDYHFDHFYVFDTHHIQVINLDEMI